MTKFFFVVIFTMNIIFFAQGRGGHHNRGKHHDLAIVIITIVLAFVLTHSILSLQWKKFSLRNLKILVQSQQAQCLGRGSHHSCGGPHAQVVQPDLDRVGFHDHSEISGQAVGTTVVALIFLNFMMKFFFITKS